MRAAPLVKIRKQRFLHLGITWLHRHQMLPTVPIVCYMVVHRDLFPQSASEKAHRVIVVRHAPVNRHYLALGVPFPAFSRNEHIRRPVPHFPEFFDSVIRADGYLLTEVFFERPYLERFSLRHDRI